MARPRQGVGADVALEVEEPLPKDVAHLAEFDLGEDLLAGAQEFHFFLRADVDTSHFVPQAAIPLLGLALGHSIHLLHRFPLP